MLSDNELVLKVRKLYPRIREIEAECLLLFNQKWPCGRGPTGVQGSDELDWSIGSLHSAANMLIALGVGVARKDELLLCTHCAITGDMCPHRSNELCSVVKPMYFGPTGKWSGADADPA